MKVFGKMGPQRTKAVAGLVALLVTWLAGAGVAVAALPATTIAPAVEARDTNAAVASSTGGPVAATLIASFLILFMQAGFALANCGLSRAKNAGQVISMGLAVFPLAVMGFFACGFALMCRREGVGGLAGSGGFFLAGTATNGATATQFVFSAALAAVAVAIPVGAGAERWAFKSFFVFALLVAAVVYPVYGNWVWGGGWLGRLGRNAGLGHGAIDYAGSAVVHLQGGMLALATAWVLGPRIGKYSTSGRPRPVLGHNLPMVVSGTFILAFGWCGMHVGHSLAADDGRAAIVAVNTLLAAAAGGLSACLYMWRVHSNGRPDPTLLANGLLAALVAIAAPCAYVAPWAAVLIGFVAGLLVCWSVFAFENLGVDDPVGAISVHGVNGAWGMLALGLFADGTFGAGPSAVDVAGGLNAGALGKGVSGLFYGDARQFLAQVVAVGACIAWNLIAGGLVMWALGRLLGNRVPAAVEIAGLDIPEVGVPGYPEYTTPVAPDEVPASEIAAAKAQIGRLAGA